MTTYQILIREGECYRPVGTVEKQSAEAAIRAIAEELELSASYLAIPARSYVEIPVTMQVKFSLGKPQAALTPDEKKRVEELVAEVS